MSHRILILGQPRSGTTALFLRLQAVLPHDTVIFFEPPSWDAVPLDGPVLVKALVTALPRQPRFQLPQKGLFDRTVLLLRDPRDRLVSAVLFAMQWNTSLYTPLWQQPTAFAHCMGLLRQKEHQSQSVPFWRLLEAVMIPLLQVSAHGMREWIASEIDVMMRLCGSITALDHWQYEAFLDPNVTQTTPLSTAYKSIFREGSKDAWRSWFLPEDIRYFRPLLEDFLHIAGYDTGWRIRRDNYIDPGTSSRYVERWTRVWRRQAHATT